MDWKQEARDKLRQYTAKKQALSSIPKEISRLKSEMSRLRSAMADGTPVSGGESRREEMLLSNIVQREELERCLAQTKIWVELVEAGRQVLSEEEWLILDKFFVNPQKGAADALAQTLCVDIKTVYRRKDAALRHFTVCLYGGTES